MSAQLGDEVATFGGAARPEGPPGRARTDLLWLWYLLAGAVLVFAYFLISRDPETAIPRVVLYCTISSSSAVMVFVGLARNKPAPRLPWLLLGVSEIIYAIADASFYLAHYVFNVTVYPFIADVFYLGHYPLVVVALVLLIRRRTPGRDLSGMLDSASFAVAAGMLSWLYVIGPQTRQGAPPLVEVVSVGYPVMDFAVLIVALGLILGAGRRPVAFFLLTGWLLAILAADTMYVLQQLSGTYRAGNYLDAVWLAGNLALGAAALHPTMNKLSDRSPVRESPLGPTRIAALSAAVLIAPAVLLVRYQNGELRDIPVIAGACALLCALTIVRLAVLVSDQRRLAITDGLTNLNTRRFFEAHLHLEVARARRAGSRLAVLIIDVDHFKTINDRYGHPAGDQVLVEVAARLRANVRAGEVLARYGGEEFALLVPNPDADRLQLLADRLRTQVSSTPIVISHGRLVAVTVSVGTAIYPDHGEDPGDLVSVADRALYTAKASGRDRVVVGLTVCPEYVGTDSAMSDYLFRIADRVDELLSCDEHSRAVSRWARLLSTEFGHDPAMVHRAEIAGRLHDIGKIVIPEQVLTKPGPLSADEWDLMWLHPDHGYRLAGTIPGYAGVANIIRQHHERWDGAGYPDNLSGRAIRVEARILAVCDAWAAMRSDRPYRRAISEDRAREEIRAGRGLQFDPDVVDLFLDAQHRGLVGDLRPVLTGR